MILPKIELPTYEVKLTTGIARYRPFTVKEQKILLMAFESKEPKSIVDAVKQIVSNCLLDKLDIDNLPMADLEVLFIGIRAKSMGEVVNVYYKCNNPVEDKPCGMIMDVPVNITEYELKEAGNKKVDLGSGIGVLMKYPAFNLLSDLENVKNEIDAEFTVVAGCIDKIFDKNGVYKASDASKEELKDFVTTLPTDKYDLMKNFVTNAPRVKKNVEAKCGKCGFQHKLTLEGLSDFFL